MSAMRSMDENKTENNLEKTIVVETSLGKLKGLQQEDHLQFLGVPYALPPIGELRLSPPVKLSSFDELHVKDNSHIKHINMVENELVYDATSFPAKAMQLYGFDELYSPEFYDNPAFDGEMSEDCLYLNIYAPKDAHNAPVVIWIHGGAFDHGYSYEKEFDGAVFARAGIIFVSIAYRVGVFGFLAHPWLTAEQGASGNYGLMDQIAAIDWVKEHIKAFGGNPDDITIMGQSAGAMSVQALLSSKLSKDKISKAILQSGAGYKYSLLPEISLEQAHEYGALFMELAGISSLKELREMPAEKLLEIYPAFYKTMSQKGMLLPFGPIVDGKVLIKGLDKVIEEGELVDVPLLVGTTKDDIANTPDFSLLDQGVVTLADKLNEDQAHTSPLYLYHFDRDLPGDSHGAFHSSELWYVMDTLDRCWRPFEKGDYDLARKMQTYWQNFIKTGNPNSVKNQEDVDNWPAYQSEEDLQILNVE